MGRCGSSLDSATQKRPTARHGIGNLNLFLPCVPPNAGTEPGRMISRTAIVRCRQSERIAWTRSSTPSACIVRWMVEKRGLRCPPSSCRRVAVERWQARAMSWIPTFSATAPSINATSFGSRALSTRHPSRNAAISSGPCSCAATRSVSCRRCSIMRTSRHQCRWTYHDGRSIRGGRARCADTESRRTVRTFLPHNACGPPAPKRKVADDAGSSTGQVDSQQNRRIEVTPAHRPPWNRRDNAFSAVPEGQQQSIENQLDSGLLSRLAQGHQRIDGAPACACAYMRKSVLFSPLVTEFEPSSCAIHGGSSLARQRRQRQPCGSWRCRIRPINAPRTPHARHAARNAGTAARVPRCRPTQRRHATASADRRGCRAPGRPHRRGCGAGSIRPVPVR